MKKESGNPSEGTALPTIWILPDELWTKIERLLQECDPPKRTGRKRVDRRAVFNAILFRLRTGCQWNHLPAELPDDSTIHRTFQRWTRLGVFRRLWGLMIEECDELGGVNWEWQSADAVMGKARKGGDSSAEIPPIEGKRARNGAF